MSKAEKRNDIDENLRKILKLFCERTDCDKCDSKFIVTRVETIAIMQLQTGSCLMKKPL